MGAGKGISLVSTLSKLGKPIATILCHYDTHSLIHSLANSLNHSLPPSLPPSLIHHLISHYHHSSRTLLTLSSPRRCGYYAFDCRPNLPSNTIASSGREVYEVYPNTVLFTIVSRSFLLLLFIYLWPPSFLSSILSTCFPFSLSSFLLSFFPSILLSFPAYNNRVSIH